MGQTVVEKIAQRHMTEGPSRPVRAGDFLSLRPRHVMTHDNTSAVITKFNGLGAARMFDSHQPVFALDHDIQNESESNLAKYQTIEAFANKHGVDFHPAGEGIGHQIMCEQGYVVPGSLVVASDSHSNTYGALSALGTPVVRTDAAAIWATGEFWWSVPRTVQVVLEGKLPPGATGKDVIITLCGLYDHQEVLNAVLELDGPGIATLSMDERLTIANMSTEWGALGAWFPCDEATVRYLRERQVVLSARGIERFSKQDIEHWRRGPLAPDADAAYAARIVLDLGRVRPQLAGPDSVFVTRSIDQLEEPKIAIHKAYLLSCTNARDEDLTAAARVLRGRKVAPGVKLYLAAASREIQERAGERGDWQALVDAGAIALPPGCGACIGLGVGLLEPGEVGISATNRNFKGRMGSRDARCYLASPAVVAASAAAGHVCVPAQPHDARPPLLPEPPAHHFELLAPRSDSPEAVQILEGFPAEISGRLVLLPTDNLNTDGIYGKDHTYRDLTPTEMAAVVMENYDPEFVSRVQSGDVLVSGRNFGTGSSREQAVTCLQAKGIPLVIAASFSQTYLRNAFNNGFCCIETPAFIEWLWRTFAAEIEAGARTLIASDSVRVDFAQSTIEYRGERFAFPALGSVPQSLVVAGGIENLVRTRLGAARVD